MTDLHTRDRVRGLIQSAGSRFCTVSFIKADGSARTMTIQPRVTSHIKGLFATETGQKAAATRAANHPELLNVWDVANRAPRSINLDTVNTVAIDGQVHVIRPS